MTVEHWQGDDMLSCDEKKISGLPQEHQQCILWSSLSKKDSPGIEMGLHYTLLTTRHRSAITGLQIDIDIVLKPESQIKVLGVVLDS